jgi:hypothetical protein
MAQADIKLSEWPSQNPDINPRRLHPVFKKKNKVNQHPDADI